MTFDEVGAPARLSGGPSPATNIPVVHSLLMAIQSTFDSTRRTGGLQRSSSSKNRPNRPVVQTLEQFSRMQSEREQTLVSNPDSLFDEICVYGNFK